MPSQELIRTELERARGRYHDLLNVLTDRQWQTRGPHDAWSVGEVMGHMVLTLDTVPARVHRARYGMDWMNLPGPLYNLGNVLNTRLRSGRYRLSTVGGAFDRSHLGTLKVLAGVQEADWPRAARIYNQRSTVEELLHGAYLHTFEHLDQVNRILLGR
jgi:hypothetical protein